MLSKKRYNNKITSLRFNQDTSCFIISNNVGFTIYHCKGCIKKLARCLNTKIRFIEMLYSSNIFAFSGSKNSDYPDNNLIIWDDHKKHKIGEIKFRDRIKNTILCRDKIIVYTSNTVYMHTLKDFALIDRFDTHEQLNEHIISLSLNHTVLAYPRLTQGSVRIEFLELKIFKIIDAHDTNITRICLSPDGKLLATCSERGTLIRIWDTTSCKKIKELRRGTEPVVVNCLTFSFDSKLLACSSETGTIHVFNLKTETDKYIKENYKSVFSFVSYLSSYIPTEYFNSEWSFTQYRIPEGYSIVAFHKEKSNVLYALSESGQFFQLTLNLFDGTCKLKNFYEFEETSII